MHTRSDAETNRRRPGEAEPERPEYDSWSLEELREAARRAGVDGAERLPKGELIEQLRNQ